MATPLLMLFLFFLLLSIFLSNSLSLLSSSSSSYEVEDPTPTPTPTPWPEQFHSLLYINNSNALSVADLWYDWPNGRNFNIIQKQLGGPPTYDLEWNNGTSYYYTLSSSSSSVSCTTYHFPVGILRPDWLAGAAYLGTDTVDGFLCNVWEKADFIRYYEDVATKRPVHWVFYTGRAAHVMTFEVGAVLDDDKWQAPVYCFEKKAEESPKAESAISLVAESLVQKMALRSLMVF